MASDVSTLGVLKSYIIGHHIWLKNTQNVLSRDKRRQKNKIFIDKLWIIFMV